MIPRYSFYEIPAIPILYTLSLHDALPISSASASLIIRRLSPPIPSPPGGNARVRVAGAVFPSFWFWRSEEHTSELQSHSDLVCRLLLEKKKFVWGISSRYTAGESVRGSGA